MKVVRGTSNKKTLLDRIKELISKTRRRMAQSKLERTNIKEDKKNKRAWTKEPKRTDKEATCEKCQTVLKYCTEDVETDGDYTNRDEIYICGGSSKVRSVSVWVSTGKMRIICPVCRKRGRYYADSRIIVPKPENYNLQSDLYEAKKRIKKRKIERKIKISKHCIIAGILLTLASLISGMVFSGVSGVHWAFVAFLPLGYLIGGGFWGGTGIVDLLLNSLFFAGIVLGISATAMLLYMFELKGKKIL